MMLLLHLCLTSPPMFNEVNLVVPNKGLRAPQGSQGESDRSGDNKCERILGVKAYFILFVCLFYFVSIMKYGVLRIETVI